MATDNSIPTPPFWGTRVVKGIALADYAAYLDERATFLGQWGLKPSRGKDGPSYEELVETEGRPRLRMWLDRIKTEDLLEAAVVYGYFPCYSEGNDLVVLWHEPGPDGEVEGTERLRFTFPRQRRDRRLCLADFFKSRERYEADGRPDVIAFQLVTMGSKIAGATAEMFAANAYRDYLELHGLSVQLTEALAETWHARVREELGFGDGGQPDLADDPAPGLPRVALLLRLPGLPGPRGPRRSWCELLDAGAHRRLAVRGAPAAPRAVDRRARRPPPGGQVLQCRLSSPIA